MTATIQTIDTPDGAFTIVADDRGRVLASGWTADAEAALARIHPRLRPSTVRRGRDGCRGRRPRVLRRRPHGDRRRRGRAGAAPRCSSPAGRRCAASSRGTRSSYAEFAAALGQPSAVRAAASICARNAPALFVPCHRVLRSDGSLGGFAWGLDVKRSLLAREAAA